MRTFARESAPRALARRGLFAVLASGCFASAASFACGLDHLGNGGEEAVALEAGDAPARADGPRDDSEVVPTPRPPCDRAKPWSAPTRVPALNGVTPSGAARLTPDLLTAYFQAGTPKRLYIARRDSADRPFEPPVLLRITGAEDAGSSNMGSPSVTPDNLTIFYEVSGDGFAKVNVATRARTDLPFSNPLLALGSGETAITSQPFVRSDGLEIYFVSRRPPAPNDRGDVFRAKLDGGVPDTATHVTELSSTFDERGPVVTEDGLTMYISSLRDADGGAAPRHNIFVSTRATTGAPFSSVSFVPELYSEGNEHVTWIAPDGCSMYLTSSREDAVDKIFFAVRPE